MKKFILPIIAVLALASIAEANGPRAVAFRGGGNVGFRGYGGNFRGAAFNVGARFAFRGPVGFARDAFRGYGFNNFAFRGHGLGFNNFAFRGHQNFYGSAFRNSYFAQRYIQPIYVQPFVQSYVQPVYTQGFAAEVDGCVGAYTQPFAAYQGFSGLGFGHGHGYGHRHTYGGFNGSPFRRY